MFTFSEADDSSAFFVLWESSLNFPITQKRSARIALRRKRSMSHKRPAAGGESSEAGFFVLLWESSLNFPITQKRSARIALRRKKSMSHMQPAAGGESCSSGCEPTGRSGQTPQRWRGGEIERVRDFPVLIKTQSGGREYYGRSDKFCIPGQ